MIYTKETFTRNGSDLVDGQIKLDIELFTNKFTTGLCTQGNKKLRLNELDCGAGITLSC